MNVRITNVTDAPGQPPQEVRVYNKRLLPGKHLDMPAKYVDDKVRSLESAGYIAIGALPPWYIDYKSKRLSADEVNDRIASRKDYFEVREAAKAEPKKSTPPEKVTANIRPPVRTEELLDLSDSPSVDDDVETTPSSKSKRKSKKRD